MLSARGDILPVDTGGSVYGGAAVANGLVYVGTGYGRIGAKPGNKVFAFGLPPG